MSTPAVLFMCVKNAGKSQMAAALLRRAATAAGQDIEVLSAGTHPGPAVNEESRASIERVGGSFDGEYPKGVDEEVLRRVDRVILIGDAVQLEPIEGMRGSIERWSTDEPSARGIEGTERMDLIRDDLAARVEKLRTELG